MKVHNFIEILKENLEIDSVELTEQTKLSSLEEYDSLAVMSIIALSDEHFSKRLSANQFSSITTVRSLMELIGMEHFKE